ncbi:DNA polymerase IV [Alcaligenes sp. 1735tsa3]|uniref:DNA polymerase IV n=1 Tax=Alcaligenes sp. 1735tsa3 TaxID=2953809 RepID=UPI0020A6EAD1|nr:DNA polymerase IV [Alcaligenes sp. 1735tsa3]USY25563.1 DNA polymerase IV [Alcaligenes sp. 1735tsa3]
MVYIYTVNGLIKVAAQEEKPLERRIAHVDMDAFYASVELLRYPHLRGSPVVIGGRSADAPRQLPDGSWQHARLADYVGRGVATTSTYEARQLGVFSAMGLMKAAQLAPDAILLPADFQAYRHYSRLFKQAVATVSDHIEDRGIDEIYVDLSHKTEDSHELAEQIRQAVNQATGLTCSVGITPNKLLSKIASELNKPNGACVLTMDDVPTRIWPLAVGKINGIGPKSVVKLTEMGIQKIGELAATPAEKLQEHFGLRYAQWLMAVAQGQDERPLSTDRTPKSISCETTFERDLHVRMDRSRLSAVLESLCEKLEQDLRKSAMCAQTIGIKLKFEDFKTVTRDLSLPAPVLAADAILAAARQNLKRAVLDRRLRLLGVKASALLPISEMPQEQPRQLDLDGLF